MTDVQCPVCNHEWTMMYDAERVIGATTDCPNCNTLLLGVVMLRSFHEVMHEQNPEWPVDGTNTGFIDIESGDVTMEGE